jgi:hypothetical protein
MKRVVTAIVLLLSLALLASCRTVAPAAPPVASEMPPGAATARSLPTTPQALATVVPPAATPPAVPRITVDDLWQRIQGGEAVVVVDARGLDDYNLKHIAGAISMPEGEVSRRANELPKDSLLVFYCT